MARQQGSEPILFMLAVFIAIMFVSGVIATIVEVLS